MFDTALLSRIQFAFTIGFHIIFPTLNLGLGVFLSIMEYRWLKTGNKLYLEICKFWTKVFALTMGMGIVSGIVMSYELGTNFPGYTYAIGGVLGSLFAYEVLTAFFLEAGFLGVMLFGWNKVSPRLHYLATLLVTIGTTISAFWIMSANSWMQTPAGYIKQGDKFIVNDWWQVIFNPSFIPRYTHMLLASYLSACFLVAGISAWYLLRQKHVDFAKRCFSLVIGAALFLAPAQILLGDMVGLYVHKHQPLKTAAMEGLWETTRGAPLILFGIPDPSQEKNHLEVKIPKLASLINGHTWDAELIGLKSVAKDQRPVVPMTFFGFRIMVGIGFFFLALAAWAFYLRLRQRLYTNRWLLWGCILATPLGFVATIAGWITAESGRQPWVVYGQLLTKDTVAQLTAHQVAISLAAFFIVYGIVFSLYLYYVLKLLRHGPDPHEQAPDPIFTYMHQELP
jgi:cytochrome d ubiquinol oxidase subunit I